MGPETAIIGCGDGLAGDGDAGGAVVETLKRWRPPIWARLISVRDAESFDPKELVYTLEIYVVTTIPADWGGGVRVWKANEINSDLLPASVERICARLAAADVSPERIVCVGVEAPRFGFGDGMTADLAEGVQQAADLIVRRMSLRALAAAA